MNLRGKIAPEEKIQAVEDYLKMRKGSTQIREELGIRLSTFQTWLRKYQTEGAAGLQPKKCFPLPILAEAGGSGGLFRRRRIAGHYVSQMAVLYCIGQQLDYRQTSEQYKITYQQIYSWVKKYQEQGEAGLLDRRGKRRPVSEYSAEEKAAAKLRQIEQGVYSR